MGSRGAGGAAVVNGAAGSGAGVEAAGSNIWGAFHLRLVRLCLLVLLSLEDFHSQVKAGP